MRTYLLSPKIEGLQPRLIPATSRAQAPAIAAGTTWDATPADAVTARAWGILGLKPEVAEAPADLLDGAEGGAG